jgi:hypothetical protein
VLKVPKVELELKERYRAILVLKVLKERRVLKVLKEPFKVMLVVKVLKDFKVVKEQMPVFSPWVLKVRLVLKVLKDSLAQMVKLLEHKVPKVL